MIRPRVTVLAGTGVMIAAACAACASRPGPSPVQPLSSPRRATVYVVNQGSKTVTPVFAATGTAGRPIKVPGRPGALAAGLGGRTVYVVSAVYRPSKPGFVTPIQTATGTVTAPVAVGDLPSGVAVTPDGTTAWVVNDTSVTPVATATKRVGRPVRVVFNNWDNANAIVISPDGKTAYVATSFTVVPIRLATRQAGRPIRLGNKSHEHSLIAITPDGRELYVITGAGSLPVPSDLFPVNTATSKAGKAIAAGAVNAIALSPDGATLYAGSLAGKDPDFASVVVPVSTSTNRAAKPIKIGRPGPNAGVSSLAVTPSGSRLYAAANTAVFPVNTRTRQVGRAIKVAPRGYYPAVIAVSPDGTTAWALSVNNNTNAGLVTPISVATNSAGKPIRVGNNPVCLLVTTGAAKFPPATRNLLLRHLIGHTISPEPPTYPSSRSQAPWDLTATITASSRCGARLGRQARSSGLS